MTEVNGLPALSLKGRAFDVLSPILVAGRVFYGAMIGSATMEEKNTVRILVADDNASVRRYLRGILEQHEDWRVCDEAGNGQEAIDRFRTDRPDLILLDFRMPEMNGLDAAKAIAQLSPKTPILIMSLYLSRQLSEEARKVGARGACSKTDVRSVVDAVGALLREETYFPN
ncbi:MAG: response regulator transcription factor [Terriglobales bacterium]